MSSKAKSYSRETVPLRQNPNLPETFLRIHIATTRIGLVFYQHRDLHYPDHGTAAYCRKLEIRQQQTYRHGIRIYFLKKVLDPFGQCCASSTFQCTSGTVFIILFYRYRPDPTPDPELKFFFFKAYKETPRYFLTTESFI
jgi:hypothetical protein